MVQDGVLAAAGLLPRHPHPDVDLLALLQLLHHHRVRPLQVLQQPLQAAHILQELLLLLRETSAREPDLLLWFLPPLSLLQLPQHDLGSQLTEQRFLTQKQLGLLNNSISDLFSLLFENFDFQLKFFNFIFSFICFIFFLIFLRLHISSGGNLNVSWC